MNDDWLNELNKLREEDERRQAAEKAQAEAARLNLSLLGRAEKANKALKMSNAHKLLRHVQSVLLNGKGLIDVFDRTKEYDRAIALVWQGPISQARIPDPEDPADYHYILVGAKGDKLFVNGKKLRSNIPETLKPALVWAAKNPLTQSRKSED